MIRLENRMPQGRPSLESLDCACGPAAIEAARDHQVDDEEQIVLDAHTSRLPSLRSAMTFLPCLIDRRIE